VWKAADLGCGVGISSDGYAGAGFEVVGFDLIHLGAPCQRWSKMASCRPGLRETYPDLITPMRPKLQAAGVPYVIENVEGAPLIDPVWLCGLMFNKLLYRHRGFETGNGLVVPRLRHPAHIIPASKAGHWEPGTVMSIAGHIAPIAMARELMGLTRYVPREKLKEAAPAYMTAYIAAHASAFLSQEAA
jgi:DNA (cytosine-5)-methyltransferase 1